MNIANQVHGHFATNFTLEVNFSSFFLIQSVPLPNFSQRKEIYIILGDTYLLCMAKQHKKKKKVNL